MLERDHLDVSSPALATFHVGGELATEGNPVVGDSPITDQVALV